MKTDPSRELCSQVLQYDERILTRLSDWCAPHIPCYTGTPIQSDPKTIVEQSLVRPQPVGLSLEGLAFCNHVPYQTPRLSSQAVNHSKSFRIAEAGVCVRCRRLQAVTAGSSTQHTRYVHFRLVCVVRGMLGDPSGSTSKYTKQWLQALAEVLPDITASMVVQCTAQ